jgi:hypothetical protein
VTNYADLLAAESLLFAVLGVLFGVWYPEIVAATNISVPKFPQDVTQADKQRVVSALRLKALPLSLTGAAIFLVFLPGSIVSISQAVRDFAHSGFHAFHDYDAVQTAFVLVTILAGAIALYCAKLAVDLRATRAKQRTGTE